MTAGCAGQLLADTAGFAASSRSPNTSSAREISVTGSTEVLATSTANETMAPGSGTDPTEGVLATPIDGQHIGEGHRGIVAAGGQVALVVGRRPRRPCSWWSGPPASPATKASNEQEKAPPTGIDRRPRRAGVGRHRRVRRVQQVPEDVVLQSRQRHGSAERFATATLKVTVAPGSATDPAEGAFTTPTEGATSVKATVASSSSVAGLPSSSIAVAVTVL